MLRLGGTVIPVNESTSSAQKGEMLADTMRCLECYADVIVLRHPARGSAAIAANAISKPLINAGDGIGEHPTQALLDLFTIYNELGTTDLTGKIVTMVGDLKNGRTVHSLAKLLALFKVKIYYISPDTLKMPTEIIQSLNDCGIEQHESNDLEPVMGITDVLYVTRIQKERFTSAHEYEAVKNDFRITLSTLDDAKASLLIMHPLPRVGEIAEEVDQDPRAAYFRQMKNGMYVRMALLALVLGAANDLEPVMGITDVLYVTRIQKERFTSAHEYEAVKNDFRITLSTLDDAKASLLIMHPLPRVGEIAEEVDQDPRAAYFRQMKNGMYVRMALLALVLGAA
ncbi:hypothetical protein ABG067_001438 [Albugo candida]